MLSFRVCMIKSTQLSARLPPPMHELCVAASIPGWILFLHMYWGRQRSSLLACYVLAMSRMRNASDGGVGFFRQTRMRRHQTVFWMMASFSSPASLSVLSDSVSFFGGNPAESSKATPGGVRVATCARSCATVCDCNKRDVGDMWVIIGERRMGRTGRDIWTRQSELFLSREILNDFLCSCFVLPHSP